MKAVKKSVGTKEVVKYREGLEYMVDVNVKRLTCFLKCLFSYLQFLKFP